MNVYNTFLHYTKCGTEGDRVEDSIAELGRFDAFIILVMICPAEWKGKVRNPSPKDLDM